MLALITRKLGMISVVGDQGRLLPLTLLEASPNTILQIKTLERDGYWGLQLGFGHRRRVARPQLGHLKAAKAQPPAICREIRLLQAPADGLQVGGQLTVDQFQLGDQVEVIGQSRGKGFSGTIRRHNFHRQRKSHGAKGHTRRPGSIGSMYPQRVMRGKKMAGRLGGQRTTLTGLTIGLVDLDRGLLGIIGGVPGPRKGFVVVRRPVEPARP